MHLSGLKAIKAVVSSDTFQLVPQLEAYISKIVPAILTNIKNKKKKALQAVIAATRHRIQTDEPIPPLPIASPSDASPSSAPETHAAQTEATATYQPQRKPTLPSKRASITDELFTDFEVEHSAEASLRDLVSSSSASTLRTILNHIFEYFDANGEWASTRYVVHVIRCVSLSAQPQHRYILLSSVLELLDSETFTSHHGGGDPVRVKITLVRSLAFVVASGGGTVGLAVVELVDALVRQLVASVVQAEAFLPAREGGEGLLVGDGDSASLLANVLGAGEESAQQGAVVFQIALVRSVACLAVSMEYPDQLNDILSFVVNRLKVGSIGATSSLIETETRKALLRCLVGVVLARYDAVVGPSDSAVSPSPPNLPVVLVNDGPASLTPLNPASPAGPRASTASKRTSMIARAPIPLPLLIPILSLLEDPDPDVRVAAGRFLHHALALEAVECGPYVGGGAVGGLFP
ncbi:hypothetical protein HDU67_004621, partial [Dinochytrium kinnereticum]